MTELKVSTLHDWKSKIGGEYNFLLPSGITVRLKKLNIVDLVLSGFVPISLFPAMVKLSENLTKEDGTKDVDQEDLKSFYNLLNKIVIKAVQTPKVTEKGDKNSISIFDVEVSDKLAIFMEVIDFKGAQDLQPFFQK